jgi:hypothetical protein
VTPAETLAKAKQLDRFLGKAVGQLKQADQASMNKFAELAARSAEIRKNLDARADRLAERLDALPALADATLGKHERLMDEQESGIQALEDSLRDMAGHNGAPPLQDSPPAAPPSPPVTEPPVVELVPAPVAEIVPAAPPPVPAVDPTANGHAA